MGVSLNVEILSASEVGGVYPFVVVCFDGDIDNEIYKTEATVGGQNATWNHSFQLDLTTNIKAIVAANRPEPSYLTFFLFDTGAQGVPSLGSAGVLLSTVRERGRAQGDFPIVNGTGTLRLVVTSEKTKAGRFGLGGGTGDPEEDDEKFGHAAKVAGITAGVAALSAAGIGYAVHHNKKKKDKDGEDDNNSSNNEKKKKSWLERLKGYGNGSSSSDEEGDRDEHDDEEQEERDLLQGARDILHTGDEEGRDWDDSHRDDDRDDRDGGRGEPNDYEDDGDDAANDEPDDNVQLPYDARDDDDHGHEPVAIPVLEDPPEIPLVSFNSPAHEFDGADSDGQAYPPLASFDVANTDGWGPSDDDNHDGFVDDPADFDHDDFADDPADFDHDESFD